MPKLVRAVLLLVLLLTARTAAAQGADFGVQARLLYRVGACGGNDPLPATVDPKMVEAHCKQLADKMARYKQRWIDVAVPYLAKIVPANLPDKVVYPFGGGDLLTALATFPNAKEITSLSLELAGDVRRIESLDKAQLRAALEVNRQNIGRLFAVAHSKTTNLTLVTKGDLPGQIFYSLVALALYDFEPVSLRYFEISPAGELVYYSQADLDAALAEAAKLRGAARTKAELAIFQNMEIGYKKRGEAGAPRIFRHISANLDDVHLKADPGPIKHLEQKGKVAAMTKAASYLLWWNEFSIIRQYLLDHAVFMISDSTGIPPRYAEPAGFEQITYGKFQGPFLPAGRVEGNSFRKLWQANPVVALPFRYGYPDSNRNAHMMVTRKK
jgi:hypothetical protein